MIFDTIFNLKAAGFEGFKSIKDITITYKEIPDVSGIYLIVSSIKEPPMFLEVGSTTCWKPLPSQVTREVERQLITDFVSQFGKRPFANLLD